MEACARTRRWQLALVAIMALDLAAAAVQAAAKVTPVVRINGQDAPLAVDVPAPRITWELPPGARAYTYQVVVASAERQLATPDVWDSGKITPPERAATYAGPPLAPHSRYVVQVQVWEGETRVGVSRPTPFETAFLSERPEAWKAQWISLRAASDDERRPLVGARWLTVPKAAHGRDNERALLFTKRMSVATLSNVVAADLHLAAPAPAQGQQGYRVFVNGTALPVVTGGLEKVHQLSLLPHLAAGENQIWIEAPFAPIADDGAVIATIRIETADGRVRFVPTDRSWRVRTVGKPGLPDKWQQDDPEKAPYMPSAERGAFGEPVSARQPAYLALDRLMPVAHLRKTFTIGRPVARARLHATAFGMYELHVNGARVGDDVLAPGRRQEDGRLPYRTYDVTDKVRHGTNVLGALLGDGWPAEVRSAAGAARALRAELHVRYHDGSSDVIATDATWRGTTGAIRATSLGGGEHIDARRDMPGWSLATFDDRAWRGVYAPEVPAAAFIAATRPLRVGTPVRVKAITNATNARPLLASTQAAQVFDLGRTLSGWVRFRFRAPRGTRVTFAYGETLAADGRVTAEGEAQPVTDVYVAAGRLQEVFEPRFTLHRFRYVQVAGHPVPMSATALVGLEITDEPAPDAPPPAKRP